MAYEGWKNHETWAVKLWMDNKEPSYRYWQDVTSDVMDGVTDYEDLHKETSELADILKREHEDAAPEVEGVYSDLLNAALGEVDWYEIAEALITDYKENNPIEEETEEE